MNFIATRRGNAVLEVGRYRFNRVAGRGPMFRWRCCKNPSGCRATAYTLHNEIVKFTRDHNH